ncbi:hypothetical protein OAD42_05020 [Oceanospirillaceae bacterium]|nr:hypothetical protein [Oceanospirillaceae bacterium]
MNVKKMITGVALSMLLSSGAANADWGDVYYCQMTNFNEITLKGEEKSWKLEKFQFKLDQTKNGMVFESTGYFRNLVIELDKTLNWTSNEVWYAKNDFTSVYFQEGKLVYTQNNSLGATSASADCNKF